MCSIAGSFSTEKLRELVKLNLYRGQHSYSISYYDPTTRNIICNKALGEINLNDINIPRGQYGICHTQAPTTSARTAESIHPAEHNDMKLWHNGILKETTIKNLQKEYQTDCAWDTKLLAMWLADFGKPLDIDGSFSCLWYDLGDLKIFRNEISPMFYDKELNISSTKFENSESTSPNVVYAFNFDRNELKIIDDFRTVENPYFFFEG